MKKLLIISMLLTSLLTSFGQVFKTKAEWVKYVNHHQAIGLNFNLGRFGFGATYISKAKIKNSSIYISASNEFSFEDNVQSFKFGLGLSIPIDNYSLNLIPCYNTIDKKYYDKISPLSFEIGIHSLLGKIYPLLSFDPIISTLEKKIDVRATILFPF